MKVLFIGGNGNISWHCVQKAIESGYDVWELNRAQTRTTRREVQPEVHQIICDIRNVEQSHQLLHDMEFDVVCDFICYNQQQASNAIALFQDKTKQYIFISSEAVYKRKSENLPFKENAEQYEPGTAGEYIDGKIYAERTFYKAYKKEQFPITIVRPGYTYDMNILPVLGKNCFTAVQKVIDGQPMIILGDGINLWSPLHSKDFAEAFAYLIGNNKAIGEAFNITGSQIRTLNELATDLLLALKLSESRVLHIPYEAVLKQPLFLNNEIIKQNMWHHIYDNAKIKMIARGWRPQISYFGGMRMALEWLYEKDERRRIDHKFSEQIDRLYQRY